MEDLQERAVKQFDALVARQELFWKPNQPRVIKAYPFDFQFRIAPSFTKKPIQAANAPGRTSDQHVFADTDPDFFLAHIGPHTLILNKYCVVRPQYILHTTKFEPQANHLNENDWDAAWKVLSSLGGGDGSMVIYNCGVEAGSSLGHKHLQIFPRPGREELVLFPDVMEGGETNVVAGIPFRHAVKQLSAEPTTAELVKVYELLKNQAKVDEAPAHNVVLVKEWMLVLPRSLGRLGSLNAGGPGFLGMVWVSSEKDLQEWIDRGLVELLCQFGVRKH